MRVTFDTNVWNRMVFPERYATSLNYLALVALKDAIRNGQVLGFISEGFGTVEAIQKRHRAKFYAQNVPKVEVTSTSHGAGLHRMGINLQARHDLHPGIGDEFEEELQEALALGIKLLSTPYIGLPVPDRLRKNPHIYTDEAFATATTTSGLARSSARSLTEVWVRARLVRWSKSSLHVWTRQIPPAFQTAL